MSEEADHALHKLLMGLQQTLGVHQNDVYPEAAALAHNARLRAAARPLGYDPARDNVEAVEQQIALIGSTNAGQKDKERAIDVYRHIQRCHRFRDAANLVAGHVAPEAPAQGMEMRMDMPPEPLSPEQQGRLRGAAQILLTPTLATDGVLIPPVMEIRRTWESNADERRSLERLYAELGGNLAEDQAEAARLEQQAAARPKPPRRRG